MQPKLPADLGFYDLRVPEVREHQAALARSAGIAGFCYWHYWFGHGRRLLERPFDDMLASGRPDFPFCLAWANQPWTGVWHGNPSHTLIDQVYPGSGDVEAHFNLVLPAFRDRRYMQLDGKPIFVIFDPGHLRATGEFIGQWQGLARKAGLSGIHFIGMSTYYEPDLLAPFDMLIEFGPSDFVERLPQDAFSQFIQRLKRGDLGPMLNKVFGRWTRRPARFRYEDVIAFLMKREAPDPRYVPCVMPNWDNTPRSGLDGIVFENSTPALFEKHLRHAVGRVESRPPDQRIVFLKAWNEWAEGNYVEPDDRTGHAYLDAIRKVILGS